MARQSNFPLATQICEAIGVDPNRVVRLALVADTRVDRAETVRVTYVAADAEAGTITRRYRLVELGDEPADEALPLGAASSDDEKEG